jgi:hypothetical protein
LRVDRRARRVVDHDHRAARAATATGRWRSRSSPIRIRRVASARSRLPARHTP